MAYNSKLEQDPLVDASAIVGDYLGLLHGASVIEKLCSRNPNLGKPGAGRFDFRDALTEDSLRDPKFTRAIETLIANNSKPAVQTLLDQLYDAAPQIRQAYQR